MRFSIIAAICAIAILGLSACSRAQSHRPAPPEEPAIASGLQLRSLAFSQCHMNRFGCFTFELRANEGKFLLDANCLDPEKGEYTADEIEVSAAEMRQAQEILERHNTKNFLQHYRKPLKSCLPVLDATTVSFSARWSDTDIMTAQSAGSAAAELEAFFRQLTTKYGKPVGE